MPSSPSSGGTLPVAPPDAIGTPDLDGAHGPSSEAQTPVPQIPLDALPDGASADEGDAEVTSSGHRPSWRSYPAAPPPREATAATALDGAAMGEGGRGSAFRDVSWTDMKASRQRTSARSPASEAAPNEREGSVASSYDASVYLEQHSTSAPSTVDLKRLWEALKAADEGARRWMPRSKSPMA